MKRRGLILGVAIFVVVAGFGTLACARVVPSCPAGSQKGTWKWEGSNRYKCTLLPVKKDINGLEQCFEWEGAYWSRTITVPCGSRVSSVSDSNKPDPDNADAENLPTGASNTTAET